MAGVVINSLLYNLNLGSENIEYTNLGDDSVGYSMYGSDIPTETSIITINAMPENATISMEVIDE